MIELEHGIKLTDERIRDAADVPFKSPFYWRVEGSERGLTCPETSRVTERFLLVCDASGMYLFDWLLFDYDETSSEHKNALAEFAEIMLALAVIRYKEHSI